MSRNFGVRHVRLHEDFIDLMNNDMCLQLDNQLNNESKVGLWGSIPCTVWSMWQEMAVHRFGAKYAAKLAARRLRSRVMLKHFIRSAEIVINKGGLIAFEWPRHCKGWLLKELQNFITKHNLIEALCDGCAFNMKNEAGDPILKPWRVITNSERLARNLSAFRCSHEKGFKHAPVEGSTTAKTAFYPQSMCEVIVQSLCPEITQKSVPAMSCVRVKEQAEHRDRSHQSVDFIDVPSFHPEGIMFDAAGLAPNVAAMVTRLLSRKEMLNNPKAVQAVRKEAEGLQSVETWDLKTVTEKQQVVLEAKQGNTKIHLGELMTLCSVKFDEMPEDQKILKGRIVYRGDIGKDQHGAAAVYQDISANPTTVQGLNNCIAYGLIPGNTISTADAIKAYVQSTLKAAQPTWIQLPRELWPAEWQGAYRQPVVLLKKSLYGHPESGGHWERHLEGILFELGAEAIREYSRCTGFLKANFC